MSMRRIDNFGLVDRAKPLSFSFDGRRYRGFDGDTVASALTASDVRILGRSFKYHRPRGLWSAWSDDPNAIMDISQNGRALPNCQASTTYLEDAMSARAVNAWPSAARDIKGGLDLFHRWLGAGFYYKTFMWPDWHLFEPAIRKMAGLGSVSQAVLSDYCADQTFDHCDVLVVGGGAAGLTAARAASEDGQNVCLVDDQRLSGGGVYQMQSVDGQDPSDWVADQCKAIRTAGGRILNQTTAYGVYDHGLIGLMQTHRFGVAPGLIRMRADRVVLATGALDRPITFPENDRPGIMSLAGSAELLARYGVLVGQNLAVVANHSLAETSIALLTRAGAEITRIDPKVRPFKAYKGARATGLKQGGHARLFDAVLTSGGMTPVIHLWRHMGGKLDWCETRQAFLPAETPAKMIAIGAANGTFEIDVALEEARCAGIGHARLRADTRYHINAFWPEPASKGRQWIDFQHDVTLKDIEIAAQENYVSVEHLKRYTTLGMASDQGKTSNMAGLAAMAALQGQSIPEVGTTTFRPPFVPVPLELYRGPHREQNWHPLKRLPLENTHRAMGAALGEYGGWLRPGWYGDGDPKTQIAAEVRAARTSVGLFDASPLGKIDVMGPDAADFLNFIYYNTINTMTVGSIRYGFMLTEAGVIYDDGVVTRMAHNHFVVSCSSSHVDGVRMHLEAWRQDGHDPDNIYIHDTTQHWATATITGPKARHVLNSLGLGIDLDGAVFAHMSLRETQWQGTHVRIARVSFSGDTSFEVSIRASRAASLWDALVRAGAPFGLCAIGIEAMSIMRAEKGYIIIGKDTDGETMPHDLGFSGPRIKKTSAFLGDRSLHTDKANDKARRQLVGLISKNGLLPTGAHIVHAGQSCGYVTSSYDSPTLNSQIALALIANGHARMGEAVEIWHLGETQTAEICAPCFFDIKGERLHA
jgi:sarcosine oxidase subunit alpha